MAGILDLENEKKFIKNKEHLSKEDYERLAEIETELKEKGKEIRDAFKKEKYVPDNNFGKWIPVSERLPEVMDGSNGECSDDVLICVADDEQITISTGFYGYYPRNTSQQGWWSVWAYGCRQLDSKYKVIAWMPLPTSYQGEENEVEK